MAEVREVLDEALKLEPDDRASVAVELLDSLESAPEDEASVQAAWGRRNRATRTPGSPGRIQRNRLG